MGIEFNSNIVATPHYTKGKESGKRKKQE